MIEPIVAALVYAVVVSAILSAVLFAVVSVVVRTIAIEAAVRHTLWMVALLATAVMPVGAITVSAARANSVTVLRVDAPNSGSVDPVNRTHSRAPTGRESMTNRSESGWSYPAFVHPGQTAALGIVGVWLAGASVGLFRLGLSLLRVRGLKRRSSPLDAERAGELPWLIEQRHAREIYLRLSYETETPVAVGFRRPVILIPSDLAANGGLGAIEGLVLHEHAHLRRYDDWTNLAQRLIERIFWFNPLIWIFGRRIALEREIAADDVVVETTGEATAYAQSLWQLAREMRMPEHSVVAPGALFTRKQISIRIEALLERRPVLARWRTVATSGVAFTALACTVAAAASAPGIELPVRVAFTTSPAQPYPIGTSSAYRARSDRPSFVARAGRSTIAVPLPSPANAHQGIGTLVAGSVRAAAMSPPIGSLVAGALRAAAASVAATGTLASTNHLRNSDLSGRDLSGHDLHGIDWRGRTLSGTDLSGADLHGARLDGARLVGVDLSGARLDAASLVNATFIATDIDGISLRGAHTAGLRVSGVSLAGMDLRGLDVRALLGACTGCDVSGANLRNADLHGLRLQSINLSGADLRDADVHRTTFSASNLEAANLGNANLSGARFISCAMQGANVHGADTDGTKFEATDI